MLCNENDRIQRTHNCIMDSSSLSKYSRRYILLISFVVAFHLNEYYEMKLIDVKATSNNIFAYSNNFLPPLVQKTVVINVIFYQHENISYLRFEHHNYH